MPRPLPQLRRPPGLLRRPVGDPGTCAARRGNAVHGGVSAVSRGGILLHAPVGCNPPLGSAVTRTPSVPTACRGAPRRDLWTKPSRIPRSRPPTLPKNPQSPQAAPRLHIPGLHGISVPHTNGWLPYTSSILHVNSHHTSARLSPYASAVPPHVSTTPSYNHQTPKIPTLVSTRPAFPAQQTRHPRVSTNSLRRLPARYRMSRRGTNPTRPAAGPPRSTHPTDPLKFPATT